MVLDQLLERAVLEQVADRAGLEHLPDEPRSEWIERAMTFACRATRDDLPRGLDPVQVGHGHIHDHDVGGKSRVSCTAAWGRSVAWPTTSISSCCWMERAKP